VIKAAATVTLMCSPVQLQGRPLRESDIGPSLEGQRAEMFWPDDNLWYLVEINSVDMRSHQVRMHRYSLQILSSRSIRGACRKVPREALCPLCADQWQVA
jgi:hypothetical protein